MTAAFFRHRTYERYRALQQQQQAARLLGEGAFILHGARDTIMCLPRSFCGLFCESFTLWP